MTLYRIWARYEPDHINPLTGRRGQWRVADSWRDGTYLTNMNSTYIMVDDVLWQLTFPAKRKPRNGSIIRPHKELNRVLRACPQK